MKLLNYAFKYFLPSKSSLLKPGFTLIELLIVVLIMGMLGTIALPSLLKHVGKAREVEAKQGLSAIGFSQQGYHFEFGEFASNYSVMELTLSQLYYTFSAPDSTPARTISDAIPKNLGNDPYRVYSMGLYYNSGAFSIILCQAKDPVTVTKAPESDSGSCSNDGKNIQ
jgi:hypothetical protein